MTVYNIVFIFLISAVTLEVVLWYCNLQSLQSVDFRSATIEKTKSGNKKINLLLLAEMIALCIISALRAPTVGTDMLTYIPRYKDIAGTAWTDLKTLSDSLDFEFGFILFCKLISVIDPNNAQIFTVATSILVTSGFYLYIQKFSRLPQFSLLIFVSYGYWTNSFNVVRQYAAISILLMALVLWKKEMTSKKFKAKALFWISKILAVLLAIAAISFHVSSACFLVLFLVRSRPVSDKAYLLVWFVALLIFLTPLSLIAKLLESTPYYKYVSSKGSGEKMLAVLLCMYLFVFACRKRLYATDKNASLWFWMFSIAVLMNVFALKIGLFERIMRIFLVSLLTYIPNTVYSLKKDGFGLSVFITAMSLFTIYFYFVLMASQVSSGYAIPYIPYWK